MPAYIHTCIYSYISHINLFINTYILHNLWNPKARCRVHNSPSLPFMVSQSNSVHVRMPCLFNMSCIIISSGRIYNALAIVLVHRGHTGDFKYVTCLCVWCLFDIRFWAIQVPLRSDTCGQLCVRNKLHYYLANIRGNRTYTSPHRETNFEEYLTRVLGHLKITFKGQPSTPQSWRHSSQEESVFDT